MGVFALVLKDPAHHTHVNARDALLATTVNLVSISNGPDEIANMDQMILPNIKLFEVILFSF